MRKVELSILDAERILLQFPPLSGPQELALAPLKEALRQSKRLTYEIRGYRWFQTSMGNTYHVVKIYLDGEKIYESGWEYGYGEQYLTTALEWLEKNQNVVRDRSGSPTIFLRETLGATWSVTDLQRKKDLP